MAARSMTGPGYAVVSLDDIAWTPLDGVSDVSLTEPLGAVETGVDAFRIIAGGELPLPAALERLLVPLDATAPVSLGSSTAIEPRGLALVPAGVEVTVVPVAATTLLVVGAPADPAPDASPTVVDLRAVAYEVPATSDVVTAFLTGPLGAEGMKVNARRLEPDQAVPYHTEGDQEELFVPVRGPAAMHIAGEYHPTPPGTVVRVAPDVPRSAVNDGDAQAEWVMVGAPPTGGPTDWDPGAEVLD